MLILLCLLQEVVYYLVKWCSLPYEDSTWELKDDVDLNKIEEFEQLQAVKPDSRRMVSYTRRVSSEFEIRKPDFFAKVQTCLSI